MVYFYNFLKRIGCTHMQNLDNLYPYKSGKLDHLSEEEKGCVISLNNGGFGVVLDKETAQHVDTRKIVRFSI